MAVALQSRVINSTFMPTHRAEMPDEPPPILGSWSRIYVLVLVYLALLIALSYGFTRYFS